ncbi:MAG: hypothetical protein ACFB4J_03575 [Elainellaceae cyanobacterium]
MNQLIFFLEEPSAKAMLQNFLPRILPEDIHLTYIVFEGKTDLEKSLPIKLKAWQNPNSVFVVLDRSNSKSRSFAAFVQGVENTIVDLM